MFSETKPNFKVKVLDAVFKVRKVHISPNAYLGITSALKENPTKYPIRRVIIKSYSSSAGSMSRSVDHVFRDVMMLTGNSKRTLSNSETTKSLYVDF